MRVYPTDFINQIICGDCLEVMQEIPDGSVDMILCDLPYGVTARNEWDRPLDLNSLWRSYKRIIKKNGAIILTSQFPYTAELFYSNPKWFRYDLVWDKKLVTGFLNAKKMPMRRHEQILVFYEHLPTYNPQMMSGSPQHSKGKNWKSTHKSSLCYGEYDALEVDYRAGNTEKFPTSILSFPKTHPSKTKHKTQKSERLFEYLIHTYSNPGEIILDNCVGSGTTAVAALNSGRNFIGIELLEEYCEVARQRISIT